MITPWYDFISQDNHHSLFLFEKEMNSLMEVLSEHYTGYLPGPFDLTSSFNYEREIWQIDCLVFLLELFKNKEMIPLLMGIKNDNPGIGIFLDHALSNNLEFIPCVYKYLQPHLFSFGAPCLQISEINPSIRKKMKRAVQTAEITLRLHKAVLALTYKK